MIFTAKIHIQLNEDAVAERRILGDKDTAIIHEVCDEVQGLSHLYLIDTLEFTDCEIKTDKEKVELPF